MTPNSDSVRSAIALAEAGSDTSTGMLMAVPPSAAICLATPSAASALMSATTTAAPSRANASAYAWPMPPPEPVTMATLFSNLTLFLSGRPATYYTLNAKSGVITGHSHLDRCRNSFGFQVLLETGQTHLAAVPGLLVTAEGRIG